MATKKEHVVPDEARYDRLWIRQREQAAVNPYFIPIPYPDEKSPSLHDYLSILASHRYWISGITAATTILAALFTLLSTPVFRAEILLAPTTSEQSENQSVLLGQFGSLASLAGLPVNTSSDNVHEALATFTSRAFLGTFIRENKLLPILFPDGHSPRNGVWLTNGVEKPSTLDGYELLKKKILSVRADRKTGLVTLAVRWDDPELAARWANDLVQRLNRYQQQSAIHEAERSIAYLQKQLKATPLVELQQVIYHLIEAETKKIMLANVRSQYAFKIIDPAVASEKPVWPNWGLIIALGSLGGLVLAVFAAFLHTAFVNSRNTNESA